MGACRTIDPARQARRQQAPCRGARSDERDHVYFEHRMPVACDPERSAAAQHTFRLSRLVELRRHAGSHPSRALCLEQGEREASPTAAIVDSQSVKSAEKGGAASIRMAMTRAKKVKGKKRHILVDTLGLLLHAII